MEVLAQAQTNGRMEVLTLEEIEGRDGSGEEARLCHSQSALITKEGSDVGPLAHVEELL